MSNANGYKITGYQAKQIEVSDTATVLYSSIILDEPDPGLPPDGGGGEEDVDALVCCSCNGMFAAVGSASWGQAGGS